MDIIGYNIIGKKFEYEEGRNERFEKSIVTKVTNLKELVGNAFPRSVAILIEKIFKIDYIKTVRIVKDEKTIGNFTLIYSKEENKNDDEMLKLFSSQVGLFISKKENDKKIKDTKERLENILEANNIGTWEHNFETGKEVINNKWAEMLGYSLEKISSHSNKIWKKSIHPDDKEKVEKEFEKLKNKEIEYYELDVRMKHRSGKYIWINDRAKITKWTKKGKPLLASGTHTDITHKKNIEIELLNNRNKLRNILETTQDGFWVVDENQRFIDVNDAYCKMSGYRREEFLNLKIPDLEFYENEKEAAKRIKKILKIGHDLFETKHIKKNGEVFDVEASASCLSKKPVEIISFCRDITEKKKMNLKTIEMKERLENLANQAPGVLYKYQLSKDGSSKFHYASNGIYDIYKVSPEEVVKDASLLFKRIHPDDYERVVDSIKISAEKLEIWDEQYRVILPKKREKWVHGKSKPEKLEDGSIIWYGNIREITREKELQLKIKDQKDRLKNVIEGTNAGTWEHDIKEDKEIVNEKWAEILGYKLKEISPIEMKKLKRMTHPNDLKKVEREFKKLINEEVEYYDIEFRMKKKNGKWVWINSKGKISKRSEEGKPLLISGTTINITEKKDKESKIEYLSFHDPLTGLYNRRYMEDSLKRLDTHRNIPFSIIVTDINGLKLTNDAYGHEMGDKLLIATAEILKNSCRKEDIICRIGGDEFVILLPDTDKERSKEIIKKIKEESENYKLDSVIVSIALGFSTKNKKDENILKTYKDADNQMYKDKIKIGRLMRSKTIETLLVNINNKYDNEQIHTERTSQYCESIAKAMKLNEKDIRDAKIAGVLHDVGKIVVDPNILNKKEKLTDKEFLEIKRHPTISYQLLKNVDEYAHLAEDVLYHHERIDGTGYPEGLKEDEIPLLSKIIAVADAYEAMTANRPYKETKTKKEAIEELKKYSGNQFDKKIVDVFINNVLGHYNCKIKYEFILLCNLICLFKTKSFFFFS
ncbi:MAG TPA: PAS domain-containing protein [Candidatus Absconditabacterales bacterium]|nr:PAS domain-containing protein [Candidatus Absconditabacterales bacterium]